MHYEMLGVYVTPGTHMEVNTRRQHADEGVAEGCGGREQRSALRAAGAPDQGGQAAGLAPRDQNPRWRGVGRRRPQSE